MSNRDLDTLRKVLAHDLMQVYVRLILLFAVAWFSVQTFAPFLPLMLWSLILAVSLNPLNQWLSERLGIGEGKSAGVFVLFGLLVIGVPTVLLGVSSADHLRDWIAMFSNRRSSFQRQIHRWLTGRWWVLHFMSCGSGHTRT